MEVGVIDLPDEYLYLIFEKLDANIDRQSFGLTCHHFLYIQNSSCKSLELGCSPRSNRSSDASVGIDSNVLEKLVNRFRQLESLSLSGCKNVSDSGLTQLQKYGSQMHSLYLDSCSNVTDIGLSSVASGCPSLSVISLSHCSISDSGLEILTKSCPSLREVNLAWCSRISDGGIWALSQNCRQLRALKISQCNKIVGVSFQGCSPTLACLEADYCAFDPMGVTGILSGGGLEYLNLSCLRECNRGHGLAAIGLGIAANLKILNFRMCSFVNDESIMGISKGCPLLQEWNLSFCANIRISGWESIGLYCNNLERLHVNGCKNLCDRGLLALRNGCRRLSMIYLSNCRRITMRGIHVFKKGKEDVEIKEEEVIQIIPSWAFTT